MPPKTFQNTGIENHEPNNSSTQTLEEQRVPLSNNVFAGIEDDMSKYPDLETKNEELMSGLIDKFPHAFEVFTLSNGERAAVLEHEDIKKGYTEIYATTDSPEEKEHALERLRHLSERQTDFIFSKDGITHFTWPKSRGEGERSTKDMVEKALSLTRDPDQKWVTYHNAYQRYAEPEVTLTPEGVTNEEFKSTVHNIPTGLLVESNLFKGGLEYWKDTLNTVENYKKTIEIHEPQEILDRL